MKIAFYNHTSTISGAEISLLLTAKHLTRVQPIIFAPEGELLEKAGSRAGGCTPPKLPCKINPQSVFNDNICFRYAYSRLASGTSHEEKRGGHDSCQLYTRWHYGRAVPLVS